MRVGHSESKYIILERDNFQLTVVAASPQIAASIHITSPPKRREDAAVKLVFPVPSLAAARAAARALGGELNAPEQEWNFQNSRVCDGHDPEGNVIQFREVAL